MDLYLSNCLKAAEAAASKAASGNLTNNKDTCSSKKQKPIIPRIGPASLLDLPLGAKLPIIPGSTNIFYTTNISEKLYQPSFGFNLNDPYCKLMETTYKSLHDPHLKSYFRRKDILKKLRKGGYITGNNKVVCSLKELNKYRQYLTTLKIDFERNYIREQKIIENQVNKLNEERRACDNAAAEFQRWLLQEGKKASPHHDRLIKLRHLNMINTELDKIEDTLGRRSTLQLKEEDRLHWDEVRRKLNLRQQVEDEWQFKEMSLLTKIGEEVRRETKVEEHHRKIREEINRKKQAMLQKRIAYHLQRLQMEDSKEEKQEESVPESKRQTETASSTTQKQPSLSEQKDYEEPLEQKSSTSSVLTSTSERLMQESRESKSTSPMTRTSFDEDRSSIYELLETRFSPTGTRRWSLAEDHTFQEDLEPKYYHHSSGKKTSFAEETLFYEHNEQRYSPPTSKRTSFANEKFMKDLLEAKYLYQNTKRTSFTDQKPMEDNLEPILTSSNARRSVSDHRLFYDPIKPKSPPSIKKTSFAEEKSFQQLMEAITPPQYVKKTSFADQKTSQESLESRRSSHHSENSIKVFVEATSLPPQQRDIQNTDLKYDKGTSHHSYNRGTKRIPNPAPSHSLQSTVLSRQSFHDIPTQEGDPSFQQSTHKQSK